MSSSPQPTDDIGTLVRQLADSMLGSDFDEEKASSWLGGSVTEEQERYWRIEPAAATLREAYLRFENLTHADHVMTIAELVFEEPWATDRSALVELFGDEHSWLPYEHPTIPRTLVIEASGGGDSKGTVCARIDGTDDDWRVPSLLVRRIWGPRRA